MRFFLSILLMTVFISCGKKTNEIDSFNSFNSFVSEKTLVIPHGEKGSIIRPKLLNKIVESQFPNENNKSNHIIQIHDELKNIELSEEDLKDYEIKEKILTKVVVSYSDKEVVYFVKERILVQNLISTLHLNSEDNRKLKLVSTPYTQSFIGASFYIVSVNHEDLMKNDQDFYSEELKIENFQEKINVGNHKSIFVKINYDFKVQSLTPVVYTAPNIRCSKDSREDGSCGVGCSYTVNLPVDNFIKGTPVNLQDLGVEIRLNENLVKMDQFSIHNSKDGFFEIKLNTLELGAQVGEFQILKYSSPIYNNVGSHYNFSNNCHSNDRSKVSTFSQHTRVNLDILVLAFGRGEKLSEIKL